MAISKVKTREEHISRTLFMLENNLLKTRRAIFTITILGDKGVEVITFKKDGESWELKE
tara:strand:+ start:2371 stop:2547 length:177 start_codon:yes stop_codon:yes gene_type:complete